MLPLTQGGVIETADRVTTHDRTVYENTVFSIMPPPISLVRLSAISTIALTNVTLPYIEALAGKGFAQAIAEDEGLVSRCDHFIKVT